GIEHNKETLNKYIENIDVKIKLQNLQTQVKEKAALREILSKYSVNFEEKNYLDAVRIENIIEDNKRVCAQLSLPYSKEAVKNELSQLELTLEYQDVINKIDKKKKLESDLSKIVEIPPS